MGRLQEKRPVPHLVTSRREDSDKGECELRVQHNHTAEAEV